MHELQAQNGFCEKSLLKQNHMALKPRPPGVEMCSLDVCILTACQENAARADTGELLSSLASRMIFSYSFSYVKLGNTD